MSTDKVFDGDQNSPQYVLFLADRIEATTTFNGTMARFIYLARRLAERLIDFEADFKKTVADTCAPDEKHCSCVPHLRRAYCELSNRVVQTFAPHLGFPHAPDENGDEDSNAPYVVDPFIAEDIIDIVDRSLTTIVELVQQFDDGSLGNEKYSPLARTAYFLKVAAIRLNPSWSSEVPTEPGYYWFYGTSEYERNRPAEYGIAVVPRLCKMYKGGGEHQFNCFTMQGEFMYPTSEGYIGKWLKFTPPTPEVDNENG